MEKEFSIRHLYSPVQPSVQKRGRDVSYREFLPDPRLQNIIYCYWQLKTERRLEKSFHYRVAADGCMDIFFECGEPSESFVAGFKDTYTGFPLERSFNYIGIRFLPAAFSQLFRINASELSGSVELLENVAPEISGFIRNTFEIPGKPKPLQPVFDEYFLNRVRNTDPKSDARLYTALEGILQARGNLRIEKDLDIYLSKRQLRRLFNNHIGGTPKSFSRIIRFQHLLKSATSPVPHKLSFLDAGYSDQAHFIREFRNFYGSTPTRALSS